MYCRHMQRNFIFVMDLTFFFLLLQALSCPLIPIQLKKPYTSRIKSFLSYLPSPSGILPFEVFQVNNRFSPYQSLLLVHWLEDKDDNFIARLPLVHKDSMAQFSVLLLTRCFYRLSSPPSLLFLILTNPTSLSLSPFIRCSNPFITLAALHQTHSSMFCWKHHNKMGKG